MNQVIVIKNDNELILNNVYNTIKVIDNNRNGNIIDVSQPITNIIQVLTGGLGHKGDTGSSGSQGPNTIVGLNEVGFGNPITGAVTSSKFLIFDESNLNITGSVNISGSINIKSISNGVIFESNGSLINSSNLIFIDSSKELGLGISPSLGGNVGMHIEGSTSTTLVKINVNGSDNQSSIFVQNITDGSYTQIDAFGSTVTGTICGINRTGISSIRLAPTSTGFAVISAEGNVPLVIGTNSIERLRISSLGTSITGSLNIVSPGVVLSIDSNNSNDNKLVFKESGVIRSYLGANSTNYFLVNDSGTGTRFSINTSGNIFSSGLNGFSAGMLPIITNGVFSNSPLTYTTTFLKNINSAVDGNVGIYTQNTNAGNSLAEFRIINNANDLGQLFKTCTGYARYKNINASDLGFYNQTNGNISILNDNASGNVNFSAGGSSTAQMTLNPNGILNIQKLNISQLPSSPSGLSTGDLWNNNGVLNVV